MSEAVTFEGLSRLTDREIQTLLREVDQKDLVIALSIAQDESKRKILANMSERVRTFITEEIDFLGSMPEGEAVAVQQRILQQATQLAEQGRLSWPKVPRKPSKKKPRLGKEYLARKRRTKLLARRPFQEFGLDDLNQVFVGFAEVGRGEGILALEQLVRRDDQDFLSYGIRLAVDGTEPDLIIEVLETWRDSLLHQQRVKYQKVIEGIVAIQSGDNPRIVESKLSRLF